VSAPFKSFVLDQLEDLEDVTSRAMFGGVGLYCRGVFFGIIARDVLYLKADDTNRRDYEKRGMPAFTPYPDRRGTTNAERTGTMGYYAVPVDVLESAADLAEWAKKSVAVARNGPARSRK
jgi:DNA transformation protein